MRVNGQQFLFVYSSVLSAVLGTVLLTGAKLLKLRHSTKFRFIASTSLSQTEP